MNPTATDVTAVVVTYNSAEVIGTCLSSLREVGRVILVDNASTDRTIAVATSTFPSVEVVANPTNVGFGRACNLGLRNARSPYILFINPDAVMGANTLMQLLSASVEFPDAAILGPALQNARGITVVSHDSSRLHRKQIRSKGEASLPDGPCCVEFLLGAVILARTDVLQAIGGFDECVFLFYEDDDLCRRVRQAGYSVIYLPQATARHLWGRSSENIKQVSEIKAWHKAWSRLYMVQKHVGLNAMRIEAIMRIAYYAVRLLLLASTFRFTPARVSWAELRGVVAYIHGRGCFPGPS